MLCAALALAVQVPAFAGIWSADECHVSLTKTKSYTQDGNHYMLFSQKTGQIPYADDLKTAMEMELLNASSKAIDTWDSKFCSANKTVAREPYIRLGSLASGSCTLKAIVRVWDGSDSRPSWSRKYKFSHTAAASAYIVHVRDQQGRQLRLQDQERAQRLQRQSDVPGDLWRMEWHGIQQQGQQAYWLRQRRLFIHVGRFSKRRRPPARFRELQAKILGQRGQP